MIDLARIPEAELVEFVTRQPWFRSRPSTGLAARVVEAPLLTATPPLLAVALVEIVGERGLHEIYQLPIGLRPTEDGWEEGAIASLDGWLAYDALVDPALADELVDLFARAAVVHADEARVEFHHVLGADGVVRGHGELRPIGRERSNSFVVFDDELVVKVYRRLDAGTNPEVELLRFLTERGFPNIPELQGWYSYSSRLIDATLGLVERFVPAESDGWTFALESLAEEPDDFLREVERLGEVTGSMHVALSSDPTDPNFAPEEPSVEALTLLAATLDEEVEATFASLPDDEALEPIAGLGEEVRERLRLLSIVSRTGRVIRHHGDYHLGEVLWTGADWVVVDFEGQRGRGLPERRRKLSPLRDVASMLRSFAYAASVSTHERGVEPPSDWEEQARANFLSGYFAEVEPSGLVPGGLAGTETLLALFELEKAVYELRYELDNRPDWVTIPVSAIQRLVETPIADTP